MKKSIIVTLILSFLLLALGGCGKKEENVIKIGAILPLTGQSAQYGKWIQEALELGKEEINISRINGKKLLPCQRCIVGYNSFNLIRASSVVNRQLIFASLLFL